jgi:hypothetical protein
MASAHSMGSRFVTLEITEYQYEINYTNTIKTGLKIPVGYLYLSRLAGVIWTITRWR